MRLAILVSGRGSNLEAVLKAAADGELPGVEPVLVISNRPAVRALDVAAAHGVPSVVLQRAAFTDPAARDVAIGEALAGAGVELALLAGYDQLLQRSFFERFTGRTINVHPSLLPRHGGRGMMGMAVHRAVLAAGDTETGATVHEVTPELDAGSALAQARLAVIPDERADALAARVLELEHRLVVEVLKRLSGSMTGASRPTTGADASHERHRTHA